MRKKILSFAVVAAMVMTVFVPVQALAKEKAEKPLLKSVKMKAYDADTKKWTTSYVTKYTYKKTYPTKILSTYYTGGKKTGEYYVEKNKYTFKNGKVKKRTATGRYHMIGEKDTVSKTKYKYNKNGLPSVATMGTTMKTTYKYKKKMLSRLSYRYTYTDDKGKKAVDKNTIRYKLKQKNGLLVEAKRLPDGDDVYTYVSWYNKKGLLKKDGTIKGGKKTIYNTYKYKTKNGRVTSVTVYSKSGKKTVGYMKYYFKYGKQKVSKQRYAMMINEILSPDAYHIWY